MDCGRHLQQRLLRRLGHTSHGQPPVHLPPIAARPGSCWDLRRPARALDELSRLHTRGMESTSTPAVLARTLTPSATYPAHTDEVFVFVYGSTVEETSLWRSVEADASRNFCRTVHAYDLTVSLHDHANTH